MMCCCVGKYSAGGYFTTIKNVKRMQLMFAGIYACKVSIYFQSLFGFYFEIYVY